MELSRVTSGVRFDTGISTADWTRGTVGQTPGQTQAPLLPGSTTVTETTSPSKNVLSGVSIRRRNFFIESPLYADVSLRPCPRQKGTGSP